MRKIETKMDARIAEEIYRAATNLGADPVEIRAVPLGEMYTAIEQLEGDRDLLSTVGTWLEGDSSEAHDAHALKILQEWNASAEH